MRADDLISQNTILNEALSFHDMLTIENWTKLLFQKYGYKLSFEPHALVRVDQRSSSVSPELIYSVFYNIVSKNAIENAYRTNEIKYDNRQPPRPLPQDAVINFEHMSPKNTKLYGAVWFKRRLSDKNTLVIATLAFDDVKESFLVETKNRFNIGMVKDDYYTKVAMAPDRTKHVANDDRIFLPRAFSPNIDDLVIRATEMYLSNQETAWNDWQKLLITNKDKSVVGNKLKIFKNATKLLDEYITYLHKIQLLSDKNYEEVKNKLILEPQKNPLAYKNVEWKSHITKTWTPIINEIILHQAKMMNKVIDALLLKFKAPPELVKNPSLDYKKFSAYMQNVTEYVLNNKHKLLIQKTINVMTLFTAVATHFDLFNKGIDRRGENIQAPTVTLNYDRNEYDASHYSDKLFNSVLERYNHTLKYLASVAVGISNILNFLKDKNLTIVDKVIFRLLSQLKDYIEILKEIDIKTDINLAKETVEEISKIVQFWGSINPKYSGPLSKLLDPEPIKAISDTISDIKISLINAEEALSYDQNA